MKPPYRLQKIAEEGSSEPYVARLHIGMLKLRVFALQLKFKADYNEKVRREFDGIYDPVLKAMGACRNAAKKIDEKLKKHKRKIETGEIISFQRSAYNVNESIDEELQEQVSAFLINGVRALKGTQKALEYFDVKIGCFFAKETNFNKGISELENTGHVQLSEFLKETRTKWSESFINRRNSIEHEGWALPRLNYPIVAPEKVEVREPKIDGINVSAYIMKMTNRILSFVESIIVYGFKSVIAPPPVIVEIPESKRDPVMPKRFRLDIRRPGVQEWEIKYEEYDFKKKPPMRKATTNSNFRPKKKIGRNAPCPCGSGKKYKKCCIDK